MNRKTTWARKRASRFMGAVVLSILFVSVSSYCSAQKLNGRSYYHEDLYSLRPKFQEVVDTLVRVQHPPKEHVFPTMTVNTKVNGVLDSINRFNITRKFIDGHTIQIYSGQNREEAMKAKSKLAVDPTLNGIMEYNQPKFRVRVGYYYSRLEAQKDLLRLKTIFPNAILVPEKILVR